MTTIEKTIVATLSTFMAIADDSQEGIACLPEILASLGVTTKDVETYLAQGGDNIKEVMFRTLRNMSYTDKKAAQQYFFKATHANGSLYSAQIFKEVLSECRMFDNYL